MKEILLLLFFYLPARWLQKVLHFRSRKWELKNDRSIFHFAGFFLTNLNKAATAWKNNRLDAQVTLYLAILVQTQANETKKQNKNKIEDNQRTIFWKFLFNSSYQEKLIHKILFPEVEASQIFYRCLIPLATSSFSWKGHVKSFWAITWQMYGTSCKSAPNAIKLT